MKWRGGSGRDEQPVSRPVLFDTHGHLFAHGYAGGSVNRFAAADAELREYECLRQKHNIRYSIVVGYEDRKHAGNNAYITQHGEERTWLIPLRFSTAAGDLPALMSAYPGNQDGATSLARALIAADKEGRAPRLLSLNAKPEVLCIMTDVIASLHNTWVLLSHLGLPGPIDDPHEVVGRLGPLRGLAGLPNVSVKLSGQYAASRVGYPHDDVRPIVDWIAQHCGIEALTWGSDFSPCLDFISFQNSIDCILPTGVGANEVHKIRFDNAHRMFERYVGELS